MKEIVQLMEECNALASQAYDAYKPIVEDYIANNSQESKQIQLTLDYMLDFCFDSKFLVLYRKLCNHLYFVDPNAALNYVEQYIETWDEEKTKFGKGFTSEEIETILNSEKFKDIKKVFGKRVSE
jgi:hypothetical protein